MNRETIRSTVATISLVLFFWFVFTGLADQAIKQQYLHHSEVYWKSPLFSHDIPPKRRLHLLDPLFWRFLEESHRKGQPPRLIIDSVDVMEVDDGFSVMFVIIPDEKEAVPAYVLLEGSKDDLRYYLEQVQSMIVDAAKDAGFRKSPEIVLGPWVQYQMGENLCLGPVPDVNAPAGPQTTWSTLDEAMQILKKLQQKDVMFDQLIFSLRDARLLQDRRTTPWTVLYRVAVEAVGYRDTEEIVIARFHYDVPFQVDPNSPNPRPDFDVLAEMKLADALEEGGILHDCQAKACRPTGLASIVSGDFGEQWKDAIPATRLKILVIYPEWCHE